MIKIAKLEQLNEVLNLLRHYKQWFPYIRNDYVRSRIESNSCIYDGNVVIIYTKYKRKVKLGNCIIDKGDF